MTIYFIQAGVNGPIKIGCTNANVFGRLASLQCGNHETLHVLGTIPGDLDTERALHVRFAANAMRREWFWPTHEILALAASAPAKERCAPKKWPRLERTFPPFNSFAEVITGWTSIADFAADLGLTDTHARTFKARNKIPPDHWDTTIAAAAARGIDGVSLEVFSRLAGAQSNRLERLRKPATADRRAA